MPNKEVTLRLGNYCPIIVEHVSQGDTDWTWVFQVVDDHGQIYAPEVRYAILAGNKPDGHAFAYLCTKDVDTYKLPPSAYDIQMTAAAGDVRAELRLLGSNGKGLGSCNFTIRVEEGPEGAVTVASDSSLPAYLTILQELGVLVGKVETLPDDVPGWIGDWLEDHISGGQGVAVDNTLTVQGAAADAKATGDRLTALEEATIETDDTLTIEGAAADAKAVGLRISGAEASIKAITEAGYEKTFALTPMHTDNNYKLLASGLEASASGYKVTEFYVNPGDIIHLKASADTEGVWHFQSLPTVSTKNTNNRVGETHTEAINGFIVVPATANYLVVSQASDNAYNEVTYARQFSAAQKADAMASLVVPAAVKAAIIYLLNKAAYTDPSLSAYKAAIDGWAETDNAIGSNMHGWTSGVQYTDLTLVENEYYKYSTGVINPETGSTRTGYVPCSGVKRLSLPRYRDNNTYYNQNWFFTADHAPISGFVFSKDGRTEVTVPSSAAYFGVSANDACLRQILGAGIIPYGE